MLASVGNLASTGVSSLQESDTDSSHVLIERKRAAPEIMCVFLLKLYYIERVVL